MFRPAAADSFADLFEPSFARELELVQRAVSYYEGCMPALLGNELGASIARYYHVAPHTSPAQIRFKALFFATRLQPALQYAERFRAEHGRAPRVLDVGCGYGLETTLLAAAGADVAGLDYVRAKIEGARAVSPVLRAQAGAAREISYEVGDVNAVSPDAAYDAVYASATLHHIEPVRPACQAIARLLVKGGVFFLSDENGASPAQQLAVQRGIGWKSRRVLRRIDPETGQTTLYGNENIRPPFLWRRHLRSVGLVPLGIKYCRFLPPLALDVERLLRAERVLRKIPLLRQVGAIGFVAGFGRPASS